MGLQNEFESQIKKEKRIAVPAYNLGIVKRAISYQRMILYLDCIMYCFSIKLISLFFFFQVLFMLTCYITW